MKKIETKAELVKRVKQANPTWTISRIRALSKRELIHVLYQISQGYKG